MKRIAIFNDFQLPLPAVKGGSVPTLTNFIIDQNELKEKYQIEVFSCYNKYAVKESSKYVHTKFIYSKNANKIRFFTNLKFIVQKRFHIPFNLAAIKIPRDIKRYFESQKYDIVYINGYIRGALPIIDIAKKNGAKVLVHHHVVTDLLNEPTIRGAEIISKSDIVLFVSDFATNYAKVGSNDQNLKLTTYKNAIDVSRFLIENQNEVRNTIRRKYNINENDTVILFVGRMVESKGAYELIKGFNDAGFNDSVKLMIVGGATYSSKKVTPYIQKCLEVATANSNIIFTGYVNYNDMPNYYVSADISTLISRCDEACGLVGIESMAAGLPIVTTDRGGIGEYISNECKIITPDDEFLVENITKALKKLVANSDLRRKMGNAGIDRAGSFDKKQYFERFCEIIDAVLI